MKRREKRQEIRAQKARKRRERKLRKASQGKKKKRRKLRKLGSASSSSSEYQEETTAKHNEDSDMDSDFSEDCDAAKRNHHRLDALSEQEKRERLDGLLKQTRRYVQVARRLLVFGFTPRPYLTSSLVFCFCAFVLCPS